MKASENFRKAIEGYLGTLAQGDDAFAPHYAKASKNLESCMHYIFGEVKKTGECAFDNQEIFDMAVNYYTDDTIGTPAPVQCRVAVSTPAKPDLFSTAPAVSQSTVQKTEKVQPVLGIGDRCVIEDAIVDKNCSIGNDVQIKGGPHLEKIDHPLYTVKDGIVVIKKGAVIPNGFVI